MTEYEILHSTIRIAFNAQRGIKETERVSEIDALLKCAEKQNIYPLVYYGIGEIFSKEKAYKTTLRQIGATYYVRKMAYLKTVADMESKGIQTIILKGYACASKYTREYLRVSSDCDLFVLEKDEKRAIETLETNGYKCMEVRQKHQHHSVWKHDDIGILELHTKLVEDDIEYICGSLFDEKKIIKERVRIDSQEGFFYKLSSIEEWVFLFVHTLKHFLQTGLSIQMLFDLYMAYEDLDNEDINVALKCIANSSYGKLWKVFYEYIHKYGAGIDTIDNEEAIEIITKDLLRSGWMGLTENTNRVALYDASIKRELSMRAWGYRVKSLYRRAFPERKIMVRKYNEIQRRPWLLPYLYAKRITVKILKLINPFSKDNINARIRKIAKVERLQMLDNIMKVSR